jgi:putative aldouronate transport system permease protein
MNIGWIINVGFERQMLLGNNLTSSHSEVIDTYVLRHGIAQRRFSFGTAVGMARSLISVILVLTANAFSKKFGESSVI